MAFYNYFDDRDYNPWGGNYVPPTGGTPEGDGDVQPIPGPTGDDIPGDGPVTPEPDPTVVASGGGGNNNGGGGGYTSTKPTYNIPGVPKFNPGPNFDAPDFNKPTADDAANEAGYQFRLRGGTEALERSAAARGVLRTGGTLTDITEYGQNFASQEYNNVFNRALQAYDRQYQAALSEYGTQYEARKDSYAPSLAEWQTKANAEIAATLAKYQRDWDAYTFSKRGGGGGSSYAPFNEDFDYSQRY
jgi:hypothetical protein